MIKKTPKKKAPRKIKKQPIKSYKKTISFSIIIILISVLVGLLIGSFYGTDIDEVKDDKKEIIIEDSLKSKKYEITYQEKIKALNIEYKESEDITLVIEPLDTKKEKEPILYFEEPHLEEIDKNNEKTIKNKIIEKPIIKKETKQISNKPKLAIIIDDMTTQRQINSVLDVGYVVNMSFLPPTTGHPNSAKITQSLENVYMVHLPLQASNFKFEEENTLHITDSIEIIENRIKYIRKVYPNTLYMNNHTGSKFTSNAAAMDRLFQVLKKYNYVFLDSKTTAKSVVTQAAQKHSIKMFTRNIFLDNKKDKTYIQNQLKKAIKSAKKNGMAIAIGHPYKVTFETLKESKHLLEGLELVYINQL